MITGCATYRAGVALPDTDTPVDALAARGPGRLTWISMNDPADEEVQRLAAVLHLNAQTTGWIADGRPLADLQIGSDSVVLRAGAARYDTGRDLVEIGSLVVLVADGLLVTVTRHVPQAVRDLRRQLEGSQGPIGQGPWHVVHGLLNAVVAGYSDTLADLRADVEVLEREAFTEGAADNTLSQRIYLLKREAIDFRQGAAGLVDPLEDLEADVVATGVPAAAWAALRDRLGRVIDRSVVASDLLGGILTAYQTDVALRQNEDMRRISAWVAIAAVPTLLAGLYGMNFTNMPELSYRFGYPILLVFMAVTCVALWAAFRRRNWL